MKNLKKVLALVLACAMVFGTVAMAGSVYPDVADDANYAEAVKTLSALEIIKGDDQGNFNPDATITRAEMAKILCTMIGSGDLATTATKFADVADNHWASGYIAYAQQLGYIDGYDATTFGPEDPVTYEQVLKLIMAALGYTYKAEQNGGYPTGYLYVAADREVTKGATGKGPEAAPRSTVAILVNNAMNTPVMERTTYGTDSVYEELDGTGTKIFKTLLTSKHKTYKVEGKVTNTYKQDTNLKEGYVDTYITKTLNINVEDKIGATAETTTVGGAITKTGYYNLKNIESLDKSAADYVGYSSVIYYKELDSGDIAVICVVPKTAKNNTVTIADASLAYDNSKDSTSRDDDKPQAVYNSSTGLVSKYIFSYWNDRDEDSRITTVDIDPAATVYVNAGRGVSLSSMISAAREALIDAKMAEGMTREAAEASITPLDVYKKLVTDTYMRGSFTLVDTANSGMYDLIKVTSYEIAIVDSVNTNTNRINFKPEKTMSRGYVTLSKDTNKNLAEYSITYNGSAIEVKDLQEYDVLNITTNDFSDPTYFDITVTRNVIEGTVTQRKTTGDPYVVINGEKYEVATGVNNVELPDLEDEGKFYLDANGDIVFADTKSVVNGNYAYLYSTGTGTFAGDNYVRMFTKDGADVTYKLADKVKINKVYNSSATEAYTLADIDEIFGTSAFTTPSATPDPSAPSVTPGPSAPGATPDPSATAAKVSDVFDTTSSEPLTAAKFVECLTDAANSTTREAYELKAPFKFIDSTESKTLSKFITYKVDSSSNITEITLATAARNATDEFNYVGTTATAKEWKASLAKFDGSKSLPDNAIIFFVNPTDSISDYGVKTIADLVDGNTYVPYFFSNTDEGPAAVVMLESDSAFNTSDSLAIFVEATSAKVDGDDVYNVTYWKNGAKVEAPLVFESTVDPTVMSRGDAFLYAVNQDGRVDDFAVIFSAGVKPDKTISGDALNVTLMSKVDTSMDDFKVLDEAGDADNEVYFGLIGKLVSAGDNLRATLVTESGKFDGTEKVINIPKTATVTVVNTALNDPKVVSAGTATDITASFFMKDSDGNIDFGKSEITDMNYAFVRVYKDVVTEVIYVRYDREL